MSHRDEFEDRDCRDTALESRISAEIPGLYRYAMSLVGDSVEAEDAVGETLLRAIERGSQLRSESSLRTWLHHILHNVVIDRGRHFGRDIPTENIDELWNDETYTVEASDVIERAEIQGELREALLHVPFGHRAVVVLHDADGWGLAEISEALGIGLPAAKQRLRRGRMMLVTELDKGEERRAANRGLVYSCAEARGRVSDYVDDELSITDRTRLEEHLAQCASCPPIYQALVGVKKSLGALHDPNSVVPPELATKLRRLSGGGEVQR